LLPAMIIAVALNRKMIQGIRWPVLRSPSPLPLYFRPDAASESNTAQPASYEPS
jgi:hypothetical protein